MCLRVCSNYYFCDGDVVIDVNVTDSSSQTTVHCKGKTSVPVRINVHQLTIIDDDDSFHACHATVVKVKTYGTSLKISISQSIHYF